MSSDFLFTVDKDQQSLQKKKDQEEIDKYWYKCNVDIRLCTLMTNLMITATNIKGIVKPNFPESNERRFCVGYFIFGLFQFIIIGLSYKPKYGIEFCHYSTLMILLRFSIRLMDLEGTKKLSERVFWDS